MTKNKIDYNEITKAKISDTRNIIISDCSKGGFTIAQQLEVKEDEKSTTVFMKGAFHIDNVSGLYELRDALNLAIDVVESRTAIPDNIEWDE